MKILNSSENFLAIDDEFSNLKDSKIAVVSAPYEHTVSFGGGTRKGPKAILEASHYVEFYDNEFKNELCFEKGITTIEEIDFNGKVDKAALDVIEAQVKELLEKDKFVVTLGGEHTISTAPVKAHFEKYPDMSILQFDAHSDFRDTYEGSKYSHASVMARVAEFFPPERITQLGIRAQCKEEAEFIEKNNVNTFFARALRLGEYGENWQDKLIDTLGDEIYITFDVDYFDPSIMPTTGTPEPDGLFYSETMNLLRKIKDSGRKIIGFDVVELAPQEGITHSNMLAASLVYKMMNYALG